MSRPVAVTVKIAAVAAGAGILFLIPLFRGTAGFDDGTTWTGIIFLAIAIVVFVAAFLGAGAEVGLGARGPAASAEVLSLREEQRTFKGETFAVWVARVRYRDEHGVAHEGDIDDCNEDERAILQPGRSTKVKYDPDHPDTFLWADDRLEEIRAKSDEG